MGRKPSAATLYKRSLTYPDYILNDVIPYVKNIKNKIIPILSHFDNITKDEWEILKKHIIAICEKSEIDTGIMNPFNIDKVKAAKYKAKHSSYYMAVAGNYMKYALNSINSETNTHIYRAALHLYYYIICPEKI